jgi:hypothetical protein
MASDIEKAAKHKDVLELVRLSHVYEGETDKLSEIGVALQQIIPQFDPKTHRYELQYVTTALECPELSNACSAARAALG